MAAHLMPSFCPQCGGWPATGGCIAHQKSDSSSPKNITNIQTVLELDVSETKSSFVKENDALNLTFSFVDSNQNSVGEGFSNFTKTDSSLSSHCHLSDQFQANLPAADDIRIHAKQHKLDFVTDSQHDPSNHLAQLESQNVPLAEHAEACSSCIGNSSQDLGFQHSAALGKGHRGDEISSNSSQEYQDKPLLVSACPTDQHCTGCSHEQHMGKADARYFKFLPGEAQEMMVMVSSLTPVLQRRKAVHRSHSHPGAVTSESCDKNHNDLDALLSNQLRSPLPARKVELQDAGKKIMLSSNSKTLPRPERDAVTQVNFDDAIFIQPTYAGTWHGHKQPESSRAAPKMGVGMVPSNSAPAFHDSNGNYKTGAFPNSSNLNTLPHISRTILDALHKRYYSYQYAHAENASTDSSKGKMPSVQKSFTPGSHFQCKKMNSEGESDTASSAPSSTHSSPCAVHLIRTEKGAKVVAARPKNNQIKNKHEKEAEIEALEACQWLRAAGFPQYAQMFEDGMFPIDISDVKRDHDFLDGDSIQSLFRRLNILNSCAVMKIDTQRRKQTNDESDEEDLCALSDRWEYQKSVRRWSRKGVNNEAVELSLHPTISHDSLLADQESGSHTDDSPLLDNKMPCVPVSIEAVQDRLGPSIQLEVPLVPEFKEQTLSSSHFFPVSPRLRRSASERIKSALKKMDSFKKKPKRHVVHLSPVEISGPVVTDQEGMQAKIQHLKCMDLSLPDAANRLPSPTGMSTPIYPKDKVSKTESSPLVPQVTPITATSPSLSDDPSACTYPASKSESSLSEYYAAHSQLLAIFQQHGRQHESAARRNNGENSLLEIFLLPEDHKPGSFPRLLHNGYIDTNTSPTSTGHRPVSKQQKHLDVGGVCADDSLGLHRFSMYDNIPHPSQASKPVHHCKDYVSSSSKPDACHSPMHSLNATLDQHPTKDRNDHLQADGRVCIQDAVIGNEDTSPSAHVTDECDDKNPGLEAKRTTLSEFDTILQGLYKEISDLDRVIAGDDCIRNCSDSEFDMYEQQKDGKQHSFQDINTNVTSESGVCEISSQATYSMDITQDSSMAESQILLEINDLLNETHSFEGISAKEEQSLSQTPDDEEGSNSNSSHDLSEGEDADDVSPNDSQEKVEKPALERRDSGVGSSLTRSERKHKKLRWHSFQKSHRPSISMKDLQVWGLSVCQLLPLRQLSLLRLTAIMEKCSPASRSQWTWSVPRFMKRNKSRQFDGKNVFGVPLMVMQQRTGQPLPQCVLYAMRYLRRTAHTAVGIFRKSGVRSRIQKLRDMVEAYPDSINFDELQPYDIADLLKQYFRELPECLLTNKLSETFRSIFTYVPEVQRLEALQNAVILLPEENQEVLYSLLLFLSDIAQQADAHQMTASNLAVCFAPSLFNFVGSLTNSPRRPRKNPGIPEQHELLEQKAVHECFTFMITNCKKLFMVPSSTYSRLHLSTLCNMEPVHLEEFYATPQQPGPDFRSFGEEHIQILLKEVHDKNRGWIVASINVTGIEVMYRKPQDNHPLKQWKCSVEIEAPPIEVLNRILHERHTWDDDLLSWLVLERLDRHADVFQYVLNCMAPHPPRVFTVLRYWRPDLAKEACAVVSQSVEHEGAPVGRQQENGVRAVELGSSFLMEPCGSGRSRLTYIARTDLRGRCPEWYNRVYGHQCALLVERLRDSFRQEADGPETKV